MLLSKLCEMRKKVATTTFQTPTQSVHASSQPCRNINIKSKTIDNERLQHQHNNNSTSKMNGRSTTNGKKESRTRKQHCRTQLMSQHVYVKITTQYLNSRQNQNIFADSLWACVCVCECEFEYGSHLWATKNVCFLSFSAADKGNVFIMWLNAIQSQNRASRWFFFSPCVCSFLVMFSHFSQIVAKSKCRSNKSAANRRRQMI